MKAIWWEKDDNKRREEKLFSLTEFFVDEDTLIASLPSTGRFTVHIWKGAEMAGKPDKKIVVDKKLGYYLTGYSYENRRTKSQY